MNTDVKSSAEATDEVNKAVDALKSRFEQTNGALGRANADLYKDLGAIYEADADISKSRLLRSALEEKVAAVEAFPGVNQWNPANKSNYEILLVLALGFDDKGSLRSLYLQAFRNAHSQKIPPEESAFAKWVQEKHGIVNAAKRVGPGPEPERPTDLIQRFLSSAAKRPNEAGGELIKTDFTPAQDAGNLGVFLVEHLPEGGSRVIGVTSRAALVASVIREIDVELSPSKLLALENRAKWHLNRVAEMSEGCWRGEPKKKDIGLFMEAVRQLQGHPTLAEKYFTDVPLSQRSDDNQLKLQNPEAPVLDPARYIKNAKVGVLPPVDVSGISFTARETKKQRRAKVEALPGYREWRDRPPGSSRSKTTKSQEAEKTE